MVASHSPLFYPFKILLLYSANSSRNFYTLKCNRNEYQQATDPPSQVFTIFCCRLHWSADFEVFTIVHVAQHPPSLLLDWKVLHHIPVIKACKYSAESLNFFFFFCPFLTHYKQLYMYLYSSFLVQGMMSAYKFLF